MKSLLAVTAIIGAGAGIGLLVAPQTLARLLLGVTLDAPAAVTVARAAGAALLALGVACWLARHDTLKCAARGMVGVMAVYNLGATIVLGAAGLGPQLAGVALWPAVILHAAMGVWCIACLLRQPTGTTGKGT